MKDVRKRSTLSLVALSAVAAASIALVGCGKKEEAAAPAAAPATAAKAEPLKIAFAYIGPVGDGGWTYAHDNGRKAVEKEFGDKVDVVYPSMSILAEPPVAIVDKNVDRKGTRQIAQAYLEYLYTDEGQDIIGKNFYRPISEKAKTKYSKQFPKLTLFTIDEAFGGWTKADKDHFADGGSFDQIYLKK